MLAFDPAETLTGRQVRRMIAGKDEAHVWPTAAQIRRLVERSRGTAGEVARLTRMFVAFVLLAAAQDALPSAAAASFNPRAVELFERDWVLNQWAKRLFDTNGDGIISVAEAQPAALEFKLIADGDGDGRVTPYEYERAREFIIARY